MSAPKPAPPGPARRRIHGLVVEADLDLPGSPAPRGSPPFLRLRLEEGEAVRSARGPWPRTIARGPDGTPWMTLARDGEARILRVPGIGRFALRRGGREILGAPAAGVPRGLFARVLLDHVLPRSLHRAGIPLLHGSAVAGARGALVFLGSTGAGKSSLAALLAARGLPLLADDSVRLEVRGDRVLAHPAHPLLRLREPLLRRLPRVLRARAVPGPGSPPKRTIDARWTPLRWAPRAVPVERVYLLDPSAVGEASVDPHPLRAREAVLALLEATLPSDPWDLEAFARDLETLADVATRVPLHRLRVPRPPRLPSGKLLHRLI